MSHGQTINVINANTATITNGEIAGHTIAMFAGSPIQASNNLASKVAIKINSTPNNNNEQYYDTVTIAPSVVSSQSGMNDVSGIQHGEGGGGHLVHFIPLQIGNVSTGVTTTISSSKAEQIPNDMPLTIISKSSQMEDVNDIAKIIGSTLPIKENFGNHVAVTGLNVNGGGIGISKGVIPNLNVSTISTTLSAAPSSLGNSHAINGSSQAIFIHNQIPKAGATGTVIAPEAVDSIINNSNEVQIENQFAMNGNVPKITGQLTETVLSYSPIDTMQKVTENASNSPMIETMVSTISNEFNEPLTSLPLSTADLFPNASFIYSEKPNTSSVTKTPTILPIAATTISCPVNIIDTQKSLSEMVAECILPDDALETEELLQNDVSLKIISEEVDRSDAMLIIDDSTDDEFHPDEMFVDVKKSENDHSSPLAITHITNSVVLTKAKATDNRSNGSSRNLSPEPASVVLMKLPNAAQQATGTTNSSIEIPIIEALTLATNAESPKPNVIKIVATPKLTSTLQKKQTPTILMRSNSIPSASKSLNPRSSKRSQSLNSGQSIKFGQPPIPTSKFIESSEKRRHSNPVKSLITYATNSSQPNELITDQTGFSSVDEPNKENNDITLIELDDSFAEDLSEESNESTFDKSKELNSLQSANAETPKETHEEKTTAENQLIEENEVSDSKKVNNLAVKTSDAANDLNSITKSLLSIADSSSVDKKNNMHATLATITSTKSEKNENHDQTIKSFLCNKNILTITPSSSSVSSAQISPPTPSQSSNGRPALTPRVRDHNRIIDANASSARRLCRDSSIASALSMVSTFDMLNWKEDRIASARGTNMRFELNEFNLLQVHERGCPPRYRIHTPYERPIYERFRTMPKSDQADPLLYLCRTCKLYGPAVDFLAPEFCSVECLKRILGKRGAREMDALDTIDKKRSRKSAPISGTKKMFTSSAIPKQQPTFRWSTYLSTTRNTIAAPIDLFLNPFPTGPNPFVVGMKVEAIDPENCSLFCVCTIVHVQGYRLRLNFDGYNSVYDFWVNADSMDIFPPGFCVKTNRILQPPRGYEPHKFDWATYLRKTNSIGADKKFFTHLNSSSTTNRNPFTVGMFLEADDLNDTGKLCVASVADVLDERIRVHFDGWDDCYDYWVDISSPYIHPCGWHEGRQQLLVPPEYSNSSFSWRDYIREAHGLAAPTNFFVPRDPIDYRPGMKLEVVDPRNPCLIRPATVIHRTRHRVKIHFDCWPPEYIFCLEDDSPDLHPIGWCDATGHELEPPPGFHQHPMILPCSTTGCRGLGNMDRSSGLTHASTEFCPYLLENWRSKPEKIPRVEGKEIVRKIRDDKTATSTLKSSKRTNNQNENSIEPSKPAEKLPNIPYKQATRGRPRNCDRLAAAAAAAAAAAKRQQQIQQQHELQNRQNILNLDAIKKETDLESDKKQVRKETAALDNHTFESISVPVSIQAETPLSDVSSTSTSISDAKITIAKRFLCDYGPRLQQNYILWRQNAGVDIASKVQRNPLLWSTAETCAFIDAMLSECPADTSRYSVSSKFYKHDIDGAALLLLQQHDLTEILQFKLGPAVKLTEIILQLRMLVISKYSSSRAKMETENHQHENLKSSDLPK